VQDLYQQNGSPDKLQELLGRGRAKKGMFEGDLNDGELEIGQIAGLIHEIKPAKEIVDEIVGEFRLVQKLISSINI
jgi:enoyl-[acyl-carrier protein] reductase II